MPVTLVVGSQYGDEGKAKIIDYLAQDADCVIRAQGGQNAGHTVVNEFGKFVFHGVPSGIFNPDAICIIGPGTVINPIDLLDEMKELEAKGISLDNLFISDAAHIVMPYHKEQEQLEENRLGGYKIGTTLRGIGPTYADKAARYGIRAGDLLDHHWLRKRNEIVSLIRGISSAAKREENLNLLDYYSDKLKNRIINTQKLVHSLIQQDKNILVEGQLGTMRDIDHGIYPYVTSSAPSAAGLCQGAGIPPTKVTSVIGVVKAYSTMVGAGPMVCELKDEDGRFLQEKGKEFGATTGRPRRCGWLDLVALRTSAIVNGFTGLAVTKLDVLEGLPEIKVCTQYQTTYFDGRGPQEEFVSTADQENAIPVYRTLKGWKKTELDCDCDDSKDWGAVDRYLQLIADTMDAPIEYVSTGPEREKTFKY